MDISFDINNIKFNFRTAAIIRKEDKILVAKVNETTYSLIGGRVQLGETSIEALIRELEEETGYKTTYIKTKCILENFFTSQYGNIPYHEILTIHEMEFNDKSIYEKEIIQNFEDKEYDYVWKNIEDLKKVTIEPKIVLDNLDKQEVVYLIVNDKA